MPVYSVSFAFGTDHLAIFSSSLSGWHFFHSRVYQAQIDLNAELFLISEMLLFKIVFLKRYLAFIVDKRLKSIESFANFDCRHVPCP